MIGTYRFYERGRLVAVQNNLITDAGKRAILSYLAGYTGNFANDLVVGASSTAATAADKELELEWSKIPVLTISPDYINTLLVYKGRLDSNDSGKIYEAGLSTEDSVQSQYSSRTLLNFDSASDTWSAGSFVTTTNRVGADALRLSPAASATTTATLSDVILDLSGYSNTDQFRLGYNIGNAFTSSMFVRLLTDASNYYTHTISAPTSGYKVATFSKSNFVATGTPDWENITSVAVSATSTSGGAAVVDFDILKVIDKDNYTDNNILVSRVVLGSPVTKTAGVPLDIEYTLDVTL